MNSHGKAAFATGEAVGRWSFRRAACTAMIVVIVGALLAWLSNGMASAEVAKRMAARAYLPISTLAYGGVGRANITVMTMDDLDLEELGLSWPVPMDYYSRLIDKLLPLHPKALFFDILFLDDRPTELVDRFARGACRATEAGIPIYVASLQEQRTPSRTLAQLAAARTRDGRSCIRLVAPNLPADRFDHAVWEYSLQVANPQGGAPIRSAALTLACDLAPADCPDSAVSPMAVVWPARGSVLNEQLHLRKDVDGHIVQGCAASQPWYRYIPFWPEFAKMMLGRLETLPLCPYNDEIPVRAMYGVGLNAVEQESVIRNRIVLLGTAFQSQGDRILSPTQLDLAGVHAHAMALDNLLTYHGKYRYGGDFDFSDLSSPVSTFTVAALFLIWLGNTIWHRYRPTQEAETGRDRSFRRFRFFKDLFQSMEEKLTIRLQGEHVTRRAVVFRFLALPIGSVIFEMTSLAERTGIYPPARNKLSGWLLPLVLGLVGIPLIFLIGDVCFQVGPLAVIEYLIIPLGIDFLDRGNRMAGQFATWWNFIWSVDPLSELIQDPK